MMMVGRKLYLLVLVAIVANMHAIQSKLEDHWLVNTMVTVTAADGTLQYKEIKIPCCDSKRLKHVQDTFCHLNAFNPSTCLAFQEFFNAAKEPGNCQHLQCENLSDFQIPQYLETYRVDIKGPPSFSIEVPIYEGDAIVAATIAQNLCIKYSIIGTNCDNLIEHFADYVYQQEIKKAKQYGNNFLQLDQVMRGFGNIVQSLESRLHSAQKIIDAKAKAYHSLYQKFRAQSHDYQRLLASTQQRQLKAMSDEIMNQQRDQRCATYFNRTVELFQTVRDPPEFETLRIEIQNWLQTKDVQKIDALDEIRRIPIPRMNVHNFSMAKYLEYANLSIPVIFTGFDSISDRPGIPNWSLEYLKEVCGQKVVPLKQKVPPSTGEWAGITHATSVPLEQFINDLQQFPESTWPQKLSNLYVHDVSLPKYCPEILQSYFIPKYFVLDYLQKSTSTLRKSWPSLFIGGANTSSGLHVDYGGTSAWMGMVEGRKHWIIAPLSQKSYLYESKDIHNRFDADLFRPDYDRFPLLRQAVVYDSIVKPGEVVFIPGNCPHQVQNLDLTIGIAGNYVDAASVDIFTQMVEHELQSSPSEFFHEFHTLLLQSFRSDQFLHFNDTLEFRETFARDHPESNIRSSPYHSYHRSIF